MTSDFNSRLRSVKSGQEFFKLFNDVSEQGKEFYCPKTESEASGFVYARECNKKGELVPVLNRVAFIVEMSTYPRECYWKNLWKSVEIRNKKL